MFTAVSEKSNSLKHFKEKKIEWDFLNENNLIFTFQKYILSFSFS